MARIIEVRAEEIERSGHEAFMLVEDFPVPVITLAERLSLPLPEPRREEVLVLSEIRGEMMAVNIDSVVSHKQIYVKPIPELLSSVRSLAGLTILGDGLPVFLLDLNQLG